jgi:hypothetical protein
MAGFMCSAVCSVTDEPPTIMVCVNRRSAANSAIRANGVLCVSSLGADQVELSQIFAGVGRVPMNERFVGPGWAVLATGSPYCRTSRVALDCRVAEIRVSLSEIETGWQVRPNRAMLLPYERSLQPGLVDAGLIVPVADLVGS